MIPFFCFGIWSYIYTMKIQNLSPDWIQFITDGLKNGSHLSYSPHQKEFILSWDPDDIIESPIPFCFQVKFPNVVGLAIVLPDNIYYTSFSEEGDLWQNCFNKVKDVTKKVIKAQRWDLQTNRVINTEIIM